VLKTSLRLEFHVEGISRPGFVKDLKQSQVTVRSWDPEAFVIMVVPNTRIADPENDDRVRELGRK
jgi:hypothetical protein